MLLLLGLADGQANINMTSMATTMDMGNRSAMSTTSTAMSSTSTMMPMPNSTSMSSTVNMQQTTADMV